MLGKWEYTTNTTYPEHLKDVLDLFGKHGWELVSANYSTDNDGITEIDLIFKRPAILGKLYK